MSSWILCLSQWTMHLPAVPPQLKDKNLIERVETPGAEHNPPAAATPSLPATSETSRSQQPSWEQPRFPQPRSQGNPDPLGEGACQTSTLISKSKGAVKPGVYLSPPTRIPSNLLGSKSQQKPQEYFRNGNHGKSNWQSPPKTCESPREALRHKTEKLNLFDSSKSMDLKSCLWLPCLVFIPTANM